MFSQEFVIKPNPKRPTCPHFFNSPGDPTPAAPPRTVGVEGASEYRWPLLWSAFLTKRRLALLSRVLGVLALSIWFGCSRIACTSKQSNSHLAVAAGSEKRPPVLRPSPQLVRSFPMNQILADMSARSRSARPTLAIAQCSPRLLDHRALPPLYLVLDWLQAKIA